MECTIRKMLREEMPFAVELAAKEGWNPGLFDAGIFYETDPDGFLIGLVNEKPIGCVSAVSYSSDFGFIGFFIVLPECRTKGYGLQLGEAAMAHLKSKTIGIDGVFEQQGNYTRAGFRFAYRNIRYEYHFSQPLLVNKTPIVPAAQVRFDKILAYDRQCFPSERRIFLEKWLTMPESSALVWAENEKLKGYGVIRKCRAGYKIGPLFADNGEIARALFTGLSQSIKENVPVYLDIPEINPEGIRLADSFGMKKIFGTARMYKGPDPDIQLGKIFGITTFELG